MRIETGPAAPGYAGQLAQRHLSCRIWLGRAPAAVEAGAGASWRYDAPFVWVDLLPLPRGDAVSVTAG